MAEVTPKHQFSIPSEFEEPYFLTARSRDIALDAATFANAENSQLIFVSEANLGWDADATDPQTGVLFWTEDIEVTAFSTPFKAVLDGPASIELQDGEVLFFIMPRSLRADATIQLFRSNRIFLEGTRLHDLRLFCARDGDTLYFYNGKSLQDGEFGPLFGGGLFPATTTVAHQHKAALVIEPGSAGVSLLDVQAIAPDLVDVRLYRNGMLQVAGVGNDYTISLATGIVTLATPTVNASERFVALRRCSDPASPTTTHDHLTPLIIEPLPATTMLDILVTDPVFEGLDLFRNGLLQNEPDDYTLDTSTGFITLVSPTIAGERFVALRRINV